MVGIWCSQLGVIYGIVLVRSIRDADFKRNFVSIKYPGIIFCKGFKIILRGRF